ncbi:MAG: hypothetical protein PHQ93_07055 [Sulfurimonas sp.]|uniref:hypothetical protein n=1 Tax=Sulfurimonas sp. TaxID=2022749 RepID=UPI0026099018|nr:hypothetical protein [Sulfurimonas sp.]MDD5400927.1 hypothetical protein [Sulfurimonas sp.]
MEIDFNAIINGALSFVVLLILKALLDFKIAPFFVKYFYWLPVRNYFRSKPTQITGDWEQLWGSAKSENFLEDIDRHSYTNIKQFNSYCYAEFISKGITYIIFGRIINNHFVGDWYDKKDDLGYYGAFQLEITNSNNMNGMWIGHSKVTHIVKGDKWSWKKIE